MPKKVDPEGREGKSERFNMVLSPTEASEIDEWAWQHRIRSKSEAVRRLCQIGMRMERNMPMLLANEREVLTTLEAGLDIVKKRLREFHESNVQDVGAGPAEILIDLWRHLTNELLMRQLESFDHVHELASEINPLVNAEQFSDVEEAVRRSNEARAKVAAGDTLLNQAMKLRRRSKIAAIRDIDEDEDK